MRDDEIDSYLDSLTPGQEAPAPDEGDADLDEYLDSLTPGNEGDVMFPPQPAEGDVGPPGGYAGFGEVYEQRAEGRKYTGRAQKIAETLAAAKEAVTNIATYPQRLAKNVGERGVKGTLRGLARGAGEETAQSIDALARLGSYLVAPHVANDPDFLAQHGDDPKAALAAAPDAAYEVMRPVVEGQYRGAETIEPYTGDPTQLLGRGAALGAEAIAAAPMTAKTIGRLPIIGRPFRMTYEQLQRAPITAMGEEVAGSVGSLEALKDVDPESTAGKIAASTIGGTTYVGATGVLRGLGRQGIRALSRMGPEAISQYRDLLPTHLREKPYRMATRQLRYAIAGESGATEARTAIQDVMERVADAEAAGIQPTLGAVAGRAGVTESERLILRHEPSLHRRIQDRRLAGQRQLLQGFKESVGEPDPRAFNDYVTRRVEDDLQQVEDVVNQSRRSGGPIEVSELAEQLNAHGGVVTDISPRTGHVFIEANSKLGLAMAAAGARGENRIQRAGQIFEFDPLPGDPSKLMVRGRSLPAEASPATANAVLGRATQEAHDDIFGEIYTAYDDIAKRAGKRLLYAPKINKAIREAYFKGGAAQPEFLPPEIQQLYRATSDPEQGQVSTYTLRDMISLKRRVDTLIGSTTNDQQLEALRRVQTGVDDSLDDIARSRRKDMADFRPLAQELATVNESYNAAVDTWRSGLASLAQGRDPSDAFKYVLKSDRETGAAEVRDRLRAAIQQRPEIRPLVEDSILEQAFSEASKPTAQGRRVFDSKKLIDFKSRYASTLSQFPEMTRRLDNVLEAQRRADELGLPSSYTGHAASSGTLSSFMDNPGREIDAILMKPPNERMRDVGKWMARFQGDRDAIQAFKYQMWDRLVARSSRADVSLVSGPYNYINPQRVLELVEENKSMLTQLYGAEHVGRMRKMAELSSIMQRMASDQHVSLEEESEMAKAAGSVFQTAIAQIYGTFIKSARTIRTGYRLSKAINNKQARQLLAEWYANPSSARMAMTKLSTESEPAMIRALASSSQIPWLYDMATEDETTRRRGRQ